MKKRVFFKWIFCLLGGVMFFACSKDYKGLVEVDNSIENIQIKNGMLVFYTYVLYAQPFFYVEYNNNQSVASAGFTMTRNSILSSFDYNIEGGTYTQWLTEADLTGL
jgi:lipoprotein